MNRHVILCFAVSSLLLGDLFAARKRQATSPAEEDLLNDASSEVSAPGRNVSGKEMTFSDVKDKILIVQCDDSSGSGFVCEMNGRRYFVTNRHVVEEQNRVVAYFSNGEKLKFSLANMELAKGVDLVRFEVATNQPAFKQRNADPEMHEKVFVFGNSDGGDVFTDLPGTIEGIGPEKIEITSKFVHGNSGSAVIGSDGCVLGVASFAVLGWDPKDWLKSDTRFNDIKRYALRLNNINWVSCELKKLNKLVAAKKKKAQESSGVCPQIVATFNNPSVRINKETHVGGSLVYRVNGIVSLSMSGAHNLKNPVIRIVVIVDCNGLRYMFDRFAVDTKGSYLQGNVPIYQYGMERGSYSYKASNDIYAYFLEGISYYQPSCFYRTMKGIEYSDRSKLLTGGVQIPTKYTDHCDNAHPPKVLAFRFECWQNGSLAGVYNSMRPQTLNSKKIPVDWFVMGKYKKIFVYEGYND